MGAERGDVLVCRCEEVTREDIVRAIRRGAGSLNEIKRVTRAGMGLCQGKTCQRNTARILAEELGLDPAAVPPPSARLPLRPLPLKTLLAGERE